MPSPDNLQNIQEVPLHCVEIKTIESRFTRLVAQCSNQLGDNTSGWLNAMRAASGRGEKFDVHEKLKYMMEKLAEQGFLNRFQPKRLASKCIQNKPFKKKSSGTIPHGLRLGILSNNRLLHGFPYQRVVKFAIGQQVGAVRMQEIVPTRRSLVW